MAIAIESGLSELDPNHFKIFRTKSISRWLLAWLLLFSLSLISCGESGSPSTADQLQVVINPSAMNLDQGGTQTFTATVKGSNNTAVAWSVREGISGGNITIAGIYTAPAVAGTYHVVATSQADSTKTAIATIVVPSVTVTLSPSAASLRPNGTQGFTATVKGSINKTVMWGIAEGAAGGAITSTGLYTAPATTGFYHVTSTSLADGAQTATALLAVTISSGLFKSAGDLQHARFYHTATLLSNGKVLVAGGAEKLPLNLSGLATAEIFDPATGLFIGTSNMSGPRYMHTATLLPDGKVLLTGGQGVGGLDGEGDPIPAPLLDSAEIYDPATGTFAPTGKMNSVRAGHTATLLQNGKVLITGGYGENTSGFLLTAEIYDPATGSFTPTGSMGSVRAGHTATLLSDGKVLIAGGSTPFAANETTEIYNPDTGSFVPAANMVTARSAHTATLLSDGRVLLAGGSHDYTIDSTATAEIYDPATGSFTPTGNMGNARREHTATLLLDGSVLVAGGWGTPSVLQSVEIYNPVTGSFVAAANMETPRTLHTATLLQDGRVLVTAGANSSSGMPIVGINTAETYE